MNGNVAPPHSLSKKFDRRQTFTKLKWLNQQIFHNILQEAEIFQLSLKFSRTNERLIRNKAIKLSYTLKQTPWCDWQPFFGHFGMPH